MKKSKGIIVLVLVIAVGIGAWRWLEESTRPSETTKGGPSVTKPLQIGGSSAPVVVREGGEGGSEAGAGMVSGEGAGDAAAPENAKPTVGDILSEEGDDHVKIAKKLTALVTDSSVPMEEREEALAHALNLSAGNEGEVLTPLVKDPKLPQALVDSVLDEALNRPLGFQADLYLAALGAQKNPELQTKIREHLVFLTGGDDLGASPAAWVEAVKAAKKEWPE